MKKLIPNIISYLRIAGAVAMLLLPAMSVPFFTVYAVLAAFDFADGFLAKQLNAKTSKGHTLDHIASLLFIVIVSLRYFNSLEVPDWAFFTATAILFVKCASLVFGAVRFKKAAFIGTSWNKYAKLSFYLAPFWYMFAGLIFTCVVVLAPLAVACVEELVINLTSKSFAPETRTIINIKKYLKKRKK